MPMGFRILALFDNLASGSTDTFGRLIYAEFLRRGVQDMPPIRGMTADEYRAKIGERGLKDPNLSSKLPPGYGKEFATKVRNILRGQKGINGRESAAEEVMSRFMLRFHSKGSEHLKENSGLREAEGYVITGIKNEAINFLESEGAGAMGQSKSLHVKDDDGEATIDVQDQSFLQKMEDRYPIHELLSDPYIRRELGRIHPDAPMYIELSLEGFDDDEIVGDPRKGIEPMLPHLKDKPTTPQNWNKTYKPKIYKVLIDHAQETDMD